MVAPFGYNERGWYGSRGKGKEGPFFGQKGDPDNLGELSEKDVLNVLAIIRKEFTVDPERIYLMGHSMGGSGTMYLGATYPDTWAGLAPLSPALDQNHALIAKLKHLPVMVVTGDQDRLVPVANVRRWVDRMEELEMDLVYKELAGGNHFGSITRNPEMIAGVFDFFDERRRKAADGEERGEFRIFTNRDGKTIRARRHRIDANTLRAAMATAGVSVHLLGCEAICEAEFNAIVRRTGSKAEATIEAIGRRLRQLAPLALQGDTVRICCDRLGGRTDYTEPLARELPGLPITILEQSPARSLYEVGDVPGACRIEFRPEAEDVHLPVALASILAKLARELAMARLNRFFAPRRDGVRPTAGYRQDAGRWLEDMAPALTADERRALVRIA